MNDTFTDVIPTFRYTKSGLISKDLSVFLDFKKVLQGHIVGNDRVQDVSWAIKNREDSVRISLNNPIKYYVPEKKEKRSRDELARDLIALVRSDIIWASQGQDMGLDLGELEVSLTVLDNEVQEFVSKGVYPKNFPRWHAELLKLNKVALTLVMQNGQRSFVKSEFHNNVKLMETYPKALYSLKKNTYVPGAIEALLDAAVESPAPAESYNFMRRGTVSVENSNEKIEFTLDCSDWLDVFKSHTNKESYKTDFQDVPNSHIKYFIDSDRLNLDEHLLKVHGNELLTFMGSKVLTKKDFVTRRYGAEKKERKNLALEDLNSLFADLQDEEAVELTRCSGYPPLQLKTESKTLICSILNLKKAATKYLVVHSHKSLSIKDDSGEKPPPRIEYILRIP